MIYVAAPYSHPDAVVRSQRFRAANRYTARLIEAGEIVFSPLSMTHPIEQHMSAVHPTSWWLTFDEAFMIHCDACHVLKLDGWQDSHGVAFEIRWFTDRGRPVTYVEFS